MTLPRKRKVVAYITCGEKLLVFKHADFPEVGVQVPAGSIEEGEKLSTAALREGEEESSLKNLKVVKYLGTAEYDISIIRPELHERHFFHLHYDGDVQEKPWRHYEMTPSGGSGAPIAFDCYWVDIKEALASKNYLFLGFGAMLDKITVSKKNKAPKINLEQ